MNDNWQEGWDRMEESERRNRDIGEVEAEHHQLEGESLVEAARERTVTWEACECESDEQLLREALDGLKWDSAAFIEVLQKAEPAERGWFLIPPGTLTTLGELETAARTLITKLEERLLRE